MMTVGPDTCSFSNGVTIASGTSTVILGPINLMRYPSKTAMVTNQGDVTLSGVVVQVNNDVCGAAYDAPLDSKGQAPPAPNAAFWVTIDDTTFRNIASGGVKVGQLTGAYRWWRLAGTNSLPPDVTISGIVQASSL